MVKFLVGENQDFKLDVVRENYGKVRVVDLSDGSEYSELMDELSNITLFEDLERKVIFLKNFDSLKKEKKRDLLELLVSVKDRENLTLIVDTSKRTKDMEKFDVDELTLPKPWKKKEWINLVRKFLAEKGRKMSDDALELFYLLVGPDVELLKAEMEKLLLFTEDEISVEDVKEVVHKHTLSKLDDLLFAVSEGNTKEVSKIGMEVVLNTPIQLLLHSLGEHFLTLFKIITGVERKEKFGWVEMSKISKELSIPIPKLAGFLGFPLGDRKRRNHLLIYDIEMLNLILMKVMRMQKEFKTIEYEPRVLVMRLLEIAEYVGERGR